MKYTLKLKPLLPRNVVRRVVLARYREIYGASWEELDGILEHPFVAAQIEEAIFLLQHHQILPWFKPEAVEYLHRPPVDIYHFSVDHD